MSRVTASPRLQTAFMVGSVCVTLGLLIVIQPLLAPEPEAPPVIEAPKVAKDVGPVQTTTTPSTLPSREEIDRLVQEAVSQVEPEAPRAPVTAPNPSVEAALAAEPTTRPAIGVDDITDVQPLTYTIRRGDTLGDIAYDRYGSFQAYEDLFDANRDVLDRPGRLKVGQTITLPSELSRIPRPRVRPNDLSPSSQ